MSYHIATRPLSRLRPALAAAAALVIIGAPASAQYVQTNLTSSIPGRAANTDPQLTNPWGISFGPTSPIWVSDNGSGVSTLYNGLGVKQGLVVTIPGGVPTGQVFNNAGAFVVGGGNASFIFATENGTIAAWRGALGTNASTVFTSNGGSYKGLAIAGSGASARLYAANFATGAVDMLDGSFNLMSAPGAFTDPNLPAGYAPFNVQNIDGSIVVTYAVRNAATGDDIAGPGNGIVDVYDANGNLLRRLASGGALDSPWGLALAPNSFGPLGGSLLIGNFGDGTINAYDFFTGAMRGTVMGPDGTPLVNDGLWGLAFGNGNATFDPNSLYITAGLNDEADGLFARVTATPEPGSLVLMATGLFGVVLMGRKRRVRK